MRFRIYGRYDLEVLRKQGRWLVYRIGDSKRRPEEGLIVPAELSAEEVQTYLDDMLHELAQPGTAIERLD